MTIYACLSTMKYVELPVSQITLPAAAAPRAGEPGPAGPEAGAGGPEAGADAPGPSAGRRQRKKQLTRDALLEAAMELFAAKGYDRTAVHEITDAVDVSERTFFRYFASKEDLVLSFVRDGATAFAEALEARPAQEEPLTAARHAFQISLRELPGGTGEVPSYLSVMGLIDSTPALLAAYLRYVHDHDDEIIRVLAQREGVDPATDRRPRVLAAVIGSLAFLANRDWQAGQNHSADAMSAAFDAYADEVIPALTGHWAAR
jgi:AcrR family transcriptional regulator